MILQCWHFFAVREHSTHRTCVAYGGQKNIIFQDRGWEQLHTTNTVPKPMISSMNNNKKLMTVTEKLAVCLATVSKKM